MSDYPKLKWSRKHGTYVSNEGDYRVYDNGGGVWILERRGERLGTFHTLALAKDRANVMEGR